jgi:uncharacterized membrane protein required for colicin V production
MNDLLNNLPFNWFDVLILAVVVLGIFSGRKRGLSELLISTITWVTIAFLCAVIYMPLGNLLCNASVFSLLFCYLTVYIGAAILISLIAIGIKGAVGGKLIGSDVFGASEFYLGMIAGVVRFCCILIASLAILNAPFYSQQKIKADLAYQNDVYGSNFFPSLWEVQASVFDKSWSGPFIKNQLSFLLIKPTAPEDKQIQRKEFAEP